MRFDFEIVLAFYGSFEAAKAQKCKRLVLKCASPARVSDSCRNGKEREPGTGSPLFFKLDLAIAIGNGR
jgi:hypothetical protein